MANEKAFWKKPSFQIITGAAKIALIAALILWAALKLDLRAARDIVASANLLWGACAIAGTLFGNLFGALRWEMILRGVYPPASVSLLNLFWFNLLAIFYSIFIPTSIAGEAVRAYRAGRILDGHYRESTISVALDRIIGGGTWFILFLALPTRVTGNKTVLGLIIAAVLTLLLLFRRRIALREHRLIDFSRHHPRDIARGLLFSFTCQMLFVLSNYCVFRLFGLPLTFFETGAVTAAATLAGSIPISLFGIGFREGSLIALLALYGASATQALMAVSLIVLITYAFGIAGGIIELAHTGWNLSRLKTAAEEYKRTEPD